MAIQRIALGLEYEGSRYHGWQIQPNKNTVQVQLQRALSQIADTPIVVTCAGRTDVGVHAKEQVVHFDTPHSRTLDAWLRGTNSVLPPDIAIQWAREVPESFHARFSAQSRSYEYIIYNSPTRSALCAKRSTWYRYPLNHELMALGGRFLLGEHDFTAFRDADCQAKTAIRTITELRVARDGDFIYLNITANAFLHHMVRNIVGVLLPIGAGLKPVEWAGQVLASCDRRQGGVTALAHGLTLVKVDYGSFGRFIV